MCDGGRSYGLCLLTFVTVLIPCAAMVSHTGEIFHATPGLAAKARLESGRGKRNLIRGELLPTQGTSKTAAQAAQEKNTSAADLKKESIQILNAGTTYGAETNWNNWTVDGNGCEKDNDGCIKSIGWPGKYQPNQSCKIKTPGNSDAVLRVVPPFSLEHSWDQLTLGNSNMDFHGMGVNGTKPQGQSILWSSDGAVESIGWKLCLDLPPKLNLQIPLQNDTSRSKQSSQLPELATKWKQTAITGTGCAKIDTDSCIQSKNWPSNYEALDTCEIVFPQNFDGVMRVAEPFDTEDSFDELVVDNGKAIRARSQLDGVTPKSKITWHADESMQNNGWKICFDFPETLSPNDTPQLSVDPNTNMTATATLQAAPNATVTATPAPPVAPLQMPLAPISSSSPMPQAPSAGPPSQLLAPVSNKSFPGSLNQCRSSSDCTNGAFCNFDHFSHGTCESCNDCPQCDSCGLENAGALACESVCASKVMDLRGREGDLCGGGGQYNATSLSCLPGLECIFSGNLVGESGKCVKTLGKVGEPCGEMGGTSRDCMEGLECGRGNMGTSGSGVCRKPLVYTCGGGSSGAPCAFPFLYKGVPYMGCTTVDNDQPWCATKSKSSWGNCDCQPVGCIRWVLGVSAAKSYVGCKITPRGECVSPPGLNEGKIAYKNLSCDEASKLFKNANPQPGSDTNMEADSPAIVAARNTSIQKQIEQAEIVEIAMQLTGIQLASLSQMQQDAIRKAAAQSLGSGTDIYTSWARVTLKATTTDDNSEFLQTSRNTSRNGSTEPDQPKSQALPSITADTWVAVPQGRKAQELQMLIHVVGSTISKNLAAAVRMIQAISATPDDINVADPVASIPIRTLTTGVEMCEGKGFGQIECEKVGCCLFKASLGCFSRVGNKPCDPHSIPGKTELIGGLGDPKKVDLEVSNMVLFLKSQIETRIGKRFSLFKPETFTKQIAAGILYDVAIAVNGGKAQVRFFRPLGDISNLELENATFTDEAELQKKGLSERLNFGNQLCPCVGLAGVGSNDRLIVGTLGAAYPVEFGSTCKSWDDDNHPLCMGSYETRNSFCGMQWCFIDPCRCHIDVLPRISAYLPVSTYQGRSLWYSYRTCGGPDVWTFAQHRNACVNQFDEASCGKRELCTWKSGNPGNCVSKDALAFCRAEVDVNVAGNGACPCIGISEIPGLSQAMINGDSILYPTQTGSTCQAWDNNRYPQRCTLQKQFQSPGIDNGWCAKKWCYVDPCNCKLPIAPKKSTYHPEILYQGRPLFYSYNTCGNEDLYTEAEVASACISRNRAHCQITEDCRWYDDACLDAKIVEQCANVVLPPTLATVKRLDITLPESESPEPGKNTTASTPRRRQPQSVKRRNYGDSKCKCVGIAGLQGEVDMFRGATNMSVPMDIGTYCSAWDASYNHQDCQSNYYELDRSRPSWCDIAWCFVDPCNCDIETPPEPSENFKDILFKGRARFISYATCNTRQLASDADAAMCRHATDSAECNELGDACSWSTSLGRCGGKAAMEACDVPGHYQTFGAEECRCIGLSNAEGEVQVLIGNDLVPYPASVGGSCDAWDKGRFAGQCVGAQTDPEFCRKRWCYVDPCSCGPKYRARETSYLLDGTYRGRPVYFSYATCGELDALVVNNTCSSMLSSDACRKNDLGLKCTWLGSECVDQKKYHMCNPGVSRIDQQLELFFSITGADYKTLTGKQRYVFNAVCKRRISDSAEVDKDSVAVHLEQGASRMPSMEVAAYIPVIPGIESAVLRSKLTGASGEQMCQSILQDVYKTLGASFASLGCTSIIGELLAVTTTTTTISRTEITNLYQRVTGSTPVAGVWIGSPPKEVNVIFDTGSDKMVFKSLLSLLKTLSAAGESGVTSRHIRATLKLYDHAKSSTWQQKYTYADGRWTAVNNAIHYGSGSAETLEGFDSMSIGGRTVTRFPISEILMDTLDLLHTSEEIFGILGLMHMRNKSYGESIFSRLRDKGSMYSFGYCLQDLEENSGDFIWGDSFQDGKRVDVDGMRHWAVKMYDVAVPNQAESDDDDIDYDSIEEHGKDYGASFFEAIDGQDPCNSYAVEVTCPSSCFWNGTMCLDISVVATPVPTPLPLMGLRSHKIIASTVPGFCAGTSWNSHCQGDKGSFDRAAAGEDVTSVHSCALFAQKKCGAKVKFVSFHPSFDCSWYSACPCFNEGRCRELGTGSHDYFTLPVDDLLVQLLFNDPIDDFMDTSTYAYPVMRSQTDTQWRLETQPGCFSKGCMDLTGGGLYVHSVPLVGSWSLTVWVKLASCSTTGMSNLFLYGNAFPNDYILKCDILCHEGKVSCIEPGGGGLTTGTLPYPAFAGNWGHVAVTRDAGIGTLSIYFNGTFARRGIGHNVGPMPPKGNSSLALGGFSNDSYLVGSVDEFTVWNRELTGAEILLMSHGTPLGYTCEANKIFMGEEECFAGSCPMSGTQTLMECAESCLLLPSCTVFVYENSATLGKKANCYLKTNVAQVSSGDPMTPTVSCQAEHQRTYLQFAGLCTQRDGLMSAAMSPPSSWQTGQKVSVDRCRHLCDARAACDGFTYRQTDGTCWFAQAGPTQGNGMDKHICYIAQPGAPPTRQPTELPTRPPSFAPTEYPTSSPTPYPTEEPTTATPTPTGFFIVDGRKCRPWYSANFIGQAGKTVPGLEDCANECLNDGSCVAASYKKNTSQCWLHKECGTYILTPNFMAIVKVITPAPTPLVYRTWILSGIVVGNSSCGQESCKAIFREAIASVWNVSLDDVQNTVTIGNSVGSDIIASNTSESNMIVQYSVTLMENSSSDAAQQLAGSFCRSDPTRLNHYRVAVQIALGSSPSCSVDLIYEHAEITSHSDCANVGYDAINRSEADNSSNMLSISGSAFPSKAYVVEVEAWAIKADPAFEVSVWRLTPNSLTFSKVGSVPAALQAGYNQISLSGTDRIDVEDGDFLGWYSPGEQPILWSPGGIMVHAKNGESSTSSSVDMTGIVALPRTYSISARTCVVSQHASQCDRTFKFTRVLTDLDQKRWCRGPSNLSPGEGSYLTGPYELHRNQNLRSCQKLCRARDWCIGFAFKHTDNWGTEVDLQVGACQLDSMLVRINSQITNIDSYKKELVSSTDVSDDQMDYYEFADRKYDCDAGILAWQYGWSDEKRYWCCSHMGKGCINGTEPFDCNLGLDTFHTGWSQTKKTWCCQNKGKGCVTRNTSLSRASSELSQAAAKGDQTIQLSDDRGFAVGDQITVGGTDLKIITSLVPITLNSPLGKQYDRGTPVIVLTPSDGGLPNDPIYARRRGVNSPTPLPSAQAPQVVKIDMIFRSLIYSKITSQLLTGMKSTIENAITQMCQPNAVNVTVGISDSGPSSLLQTTEGVKIEISVAFPDTQESVFTIQKIQSDKSWVANIVGTAVSQLAGICEAAVGGCNGTNGTDLPVHVPTSAPTAPTLLLCGHSVDLKDQESPLLNVNTETGSDNFEMTCGEEKGQEASFYYDVPTGTKITIHLTGSNVDAVTASRWGGGCPGRHAIECDDEDSHVHVFVNTQKQSERFYFFAGGYGHDQYGFINVSWTLEQVPMYKTRPGCATAQSMNDSCEVATLKRAVICCNPAGERVPMERYGCEGAATYEQGDVLCSAKGLHVCGEPELLNAIATPTPLPTQCIGSSGGCNFDTERVWTSTTCPYPTPMPTSPSPPSRPPTHPPPSCSDTVDVQPGNTVADTAAYAALFGCYKASTSGVTLTDEQDGRWIYKSTSRNKQTLYLYYVSQWNEWQIGSDYTDGTNNMHSSVTHALCPHEDLSWLVWTGAWTASFNMSVTAIDASDPSCAVPTPLPPTPPPTPLNCSDIIYLSVPTPNLDAYITGCYMSSDAMGSSDASIGQAGRLIYRSTDSSKAATYIYYEDQWKQWQVGSQASNDLNYVHSTHQSTASCPNQVAAWTAWDGTSWNSTFDIKAVPVQDSDPRCLAKVQWALKIVNLDYEKIMANDMMSNAVQSAIKTSIITAPNASNVNLNIRWKDISVKLSKGPISVVADVTVLGILGKQAELTAGVDKSGWQFSRLASKWITAIPGVNDFKAYPNFQPDKAFFVTDNATGSCSSLDPAVVSVTGSIISDMDGNYTRVESVQQEGKPVYLNSKQFHLYYSGDPYRQWQIGVDYTTNKNWIHSEPTECGPGGTLAWKAYDGKAWVSIDLSLDLREGQSNGALAPSPESPCTPFVPKVCPDEIKVEGSVSVQIALKREFVKTHLEQEGRPIYSNLTVGNGTIYLYYNPSWSQWQVGFDYTTDYNWIHSCQTDAQCPNDGCGWLYDLNGIWSSSQGITVAATGAPMPENTATCCRGNSPAPNWCAPSPAPTPFRSAPGQGTPEPTWSSVTLEYFQAVTWLEIPGSLCSADFDTAVQAHRTSEGHYACKARCAYDISCVGITIGEWNGIPNTCVVCKSGHQNDLSVSPASWATTYFKDATQVTWTEPLPGYCDDNWEAAWAGRTNNTLDTCKLLCAADDKCVGITFGASDGIPNNCVHCTSVGIGAVKETEAMSTYTKVDCTASPSLHTCTWPGCFWDGSACKRVTWAGIESNRCAGDWDAAWAMRTVESLDLCQERCARAADCEAITYGTYSGIVNSCVLCKTGTTHQTNTSGTTLWLKSKSVPPAFEWVQKSSSYCSVDWGARWNARTVESLDSCRDRCAMQSSCMAITFGTKNGIENVCVTCSGTDVLYVDWATTYLKGERKQINHAWSEIASAYCNENWDVSWSSRRIESLASCKRRCASEPTCVGFTYGSYAGFEDACVPCQSTSIESAAWATTFLKTQAVAGPSGRKFRAGECLTGQAVLIGIGGASASQYVQDNGSAILGVAEQAWTLSDTGEGDSFFFSSPRGVQLEDRNGQLELSSNKGSLQAWTITDPLDGKGLFITSFRALQLEDRNGILGLSSAVGTNQRWTIVTPQGVPACIPPKPTPAPSQEIMGNWFKNTSSFCGDDWNTIWAARTIEPLEECMQRCRSQSACSGFTIGAYGGVENNCVLCTTTALQYAAWATTYIKGPRKCTDELTVWADDAVHAQLLGDFSPSDIASPPANGRLPIYFNDYGVYLYYWAEGKQWHIGVDYKNPTNWIHSCDTTAECPYDACSWVFAEGGGWSDSHGISVQERGAKRNPNQSTVCCATSAPTPPPTFDPTPNQAAEPTPDPTYLPTLIVSGNFSVTLHGDIDSFLDKFASGVMKAAIAQVAAVDKNAVNVTVLQKDVTSASLLALQEAEKPRTSELSDATRVAVIVKTRGQFQRERGQQRRKLHRRSFWPDWQHDGRLWQLSPSNIHGTLSNNNSNGTGGPSNPTPTILPTLSPTLEPSQIVVFYTIALASKDEAANEVKNLENKPVLQYFIRQEIKAAGITDIQGVEVVEDTADVVPVPLPTSTPTPSPTPEPTNATTLPECVNTDGAALDTLYKGCDTYLSNVSSCGDYDDDDFVAGTMCCACGGGIEKKKINVLRFPVCRESAGGCAAIIDTGSNIIAGPRKVMARMARNLRVAPDCSNMDELPAINVKLGKHDFSLPPIGYVMKVKVPEWMKDILGNQAGAKGDLALSELGPVQDAIRRSHTQRRRPTRQNPWREALREVQKRHGIDLRAALGVEKGWQIPDMGDASPTYICMPALTTVDIMTQLGPLFVVGKPLFARYYARWSWKPGKIKPSIYFEEIGKARACNASSWAPRSERHERLESDKQTSVRSGKGQYSADDEISRNLELDDGDAREFEDGVVNKRSRRGWRRIPREPAAITFEDIRHPFWLHNMKGIL